MCQCNGVESSPAALPSLYMNIILEMRGEGKKSALLLLATNMINTTCTEMPSLGVEMLHHKSRSDTNTDFSWRRSLIPAYLTMVRLGED